MPSGGGEGRRGEREQQEGEGALPAPGPPGSFLWCESIKHARQTDHRALTGRARAQHHGRAKRQWAECSVQKTPFWDLFVRQLGANPSPGTSLSGPSSRWVSDPGIAMLADGLPSTWRASTPEVSDLPRGEGSVHSRLRVKSGLSPTPELPLTRKPGWTTECE